MFRPFVVAFALAVSPGLSKLRGGPTSSDAGGGHQISLSRAGGDDSPLLEALRRKAASHIVQGDGEKEEGADDRAALSKAGFNSQERDEKDTRRANADNQKSQEEEEDHESFAKRWVQNHDVKSPADLHKARVHKAEVEAARAATRAATDIKDAQLGSQAAAGMCGRQEPGCHSMCRWLQLKSGDGGAKCPLLDNQLKACAFVMPEDRPTPFANPLDCAVELTRAYVRERDVPDYVVKLTSCVNNVPAKLNATCSSAVGLLRGELNDWRADKFNEKEAAVLRQELEAATEQGLKALEAQAGEQAAIDRLSSDLSKAETIPGHYLVAEEHQARGLLDRLGPVPVVREQLQDAVHDAHRAFKSTSLYRVKEDLVWLRVAVQKAEKFNVGPPTAEAKDLLIKLQGLKEALASVKSSVFQATVSLTTMSGVQKALVNLRDSIAQAKNAGLQHELDVERGLLAQLEHLQAAVTSNRNETRRGEALLRSHHKGLDRLRSAAIRLNNTVTHANRLGLADNASTDAAVETLDKINYVGHARAALHAAVEASSELVLKTVSVLSDDADEAGIVNLEGVISWANEAGLTNGVPKAKLLSKMLTVIDAAKEGMVTALAEARSSYEAKCCAEHAIQLLEAAVNDCREKGVTAGAAEAQKELERLHLLQDARAALGSARDKANATYGTLRGFQNSTNSMEFAIDLAQRAGIADKAKIATDQLRKLRAFADADRELVRALSEPIPAGPASSRTEVEDPAPKGSFNRSGLKPVHLPRVVLADDDGDSDFDEHIEAMETVLEGAKIKGTVDSGLKAQLEKMLGLRRAYAGIEAASEEGERALESKDGIEAAVLRLTAAVREARQIGLRLGVDKAAELLGNLTVIEPARDELLAAILQANASMFTRGSMDPALFRLNKAIDVNAALGLTDSLPQAEHLRNQVLYLKKTWVDLTAAITQGEIALDSGSGEEAAIAELHRCIDQTDEVNLHGKVHKAMDVIHMLTRQNAGKQQAQAATRPLWNQPARGSR